MLCQAVWAYSSSSVSFHKPGSHSIEGCCFPGGTWLKTWSVGLSVAVTSSSLHFVIFFYTSCQRQWRQQQQQQQWSFFAPYQVIIIASQLWSRLARDRCCLELPSAGSEAELNCPPIPPRTAEHWPKISTWKGSVNGASVSTLSHLERVQSPEFWVQSQFSASQSVRDKSREKSDGGEKRKIVGDTSGEPESAWDF